MTRGIALLLALLLGLTACAQIPTDGPVEEVPVPADPAGIEIAPQPPQADSTPDRVLDGFLLAMADPDSDFSVARAYLTEAAAEGWDPDASTTVYTGSIVEEEGRFIVRGTSVGAVDEDGHFQPTGGELAHDFALTEEAGQWRIANPPDGVLVSRYLFERFWTPLTVYYLDATGQHLVPDLLTVPETVVTPARVVQAMIDGPGEALEGAVLNAMPPGLRIGADGTSIDEDGVVTVDLAGLDTTLPGEERRRFGAQLLWSLTSIPRVSGLRVTSGGWPVALPGQSADGVLELATQQGYSVLAQATSTDLFAVDGEVPGRITDDEEFVPLRPGLEAAAEVAVPLDASLLALVDAERRSVRIGPFDGLLQTVDVGLTSIRDTQWAAGRFYALGEDPKGQTRMFAVDPSGEHELVDVQLPSGLRLIGMSVNQGGASAAVLATSGEENFVGRMTLTSPTTLERWEPLPMVMETGERLTGLRDVQWNSESSLVVIGQSDAGQEIVVLRADGSQLEELGTTDEHITSVAALPRQGGGLIALRGSNGSVWRYVTPNRWTQSDLTVSSISFAG